MSIDVISLPGPHKTLLVYAEGIGDPVDVVEVADDLSGVVDGSIAETAPPELGDFPVADSMRFGGQNVGIAAQGSISRAQLGTAPI